MLSPRTSSRGGVLAEYLAEGAEVADRLGLRVICLCAVALFAKYEKRRVCFFALVNFVL